MIKKFLLPIAVLFLFEGCMQNNNNVNIEQLKEEVWQTVLAHNKAWTVDKDIEAQMRHVHKEIVSVAPPFTNRLTGIAQYKEGYLNWHEHASVKSFKEIDPQIKIYKGAFAIAVYKIEMSFEYDGNLVDDWKGMDTMTLVKLEDKWFITSDMFGQTPNLQN